MSESHPPVILARGEDSQHPFKLKFKESISKYSPSSRWSITPFT
jgi:hypothetical protein